MSSPHVADSESPGSVLTALTTNNAKETYVGTKAPGGTHRGGAGPASLSLTISTGPGPRVTHAARPTCAEGRLVSHPRSVRLPVPHPAAEATKAQSVLASH